MFFSSSSSSFSVFVFFKRYSSGSNRTPPHALVLLFLFAFVLSRRTCLFRPFWPCVLLLGVFLGVPFWAPRVFGILLELTGLELARPFRGPFSWDARRQGCFLASFPWFVFSPFVLFCGFTRFTRRPSQWLDLRQARGARRPPLARVRARGSPSEGGGLVPSCSGFLVAFLYGRGSQGPSDAQRPGPFVGEGAFLSAPSGPFFHTHVSVCPYPRFCFVCFLFFFSWPSGPRWIAGRKDGEFRELFRESPGTLWELRELDALPSPLLLDCSY